MRALSKVDATYLEDFIKMEVSNVRAAIDVTGGGAYRYHGTLSALSRVLNAFRYIEEEAETPRMGEMTPGEKVFLVNALKGGIITAKKNIEKYGDTEKGIKSAGILFAYKNILYTVERIVLYAQWKESY